MRRELHEYTGVDKPPVAVWARVTNAARLGEWHPAITASDGEWRSGGVLALTVRFGSVERTRRLSVVVLRFVPRRELSCVVRTGVAGILDFHYALRLEPDAAGGTEVSQALTTSGVLALPLWRRLRGPLAEFLRQGAAGLGGGGESADAVTE